MQTEIRPLEPGDYLRHRELMAQAFGRGHTVAPPADDDPPPDMANKWGLFFGKDLQAALTIAPFNVHWGAPGVGSPETVLPMGGIAGVSTWAHARGKGYVAELLTESLRVMKERGDVVSALYPFSFAFYRRFGWDWVGEKRVVTFPLRDLRAASEGRMVRDITERDGVTVRPKIEAAYTNFARQYRGVSTADTRRWEGWFANRGRTGYVYEYEPTGEYLTWWYDTESRKGTIREWITRTPDGFRAHLSLMHYLGTQCDTVLVCLPGDSFLPAHFMHNDMETKIQPVYMGRVVDFSQALLSLPPVPDVPNGSLTLALHDEHAPWNAGQWNVGVENGRIFCTKSDGKAKTADVAMDIRALSQAFWGTPSLLWLRNAGRLDSVTDEAAFALLFRLLPAHPVYTLDDF